MIDINFAITWLVALPLVSAPVIYLFGRLYFRRRGASDNNPAKWLALLALLGTGVMWYYTYLSARDMPVRLSVGDIALRVDGISNLMTFTALVLGILVTIFSFKYMAGEPGEEKFYALLVANIGTISGLCMATDLFNPWVWFEAMAVTTFLLVSFYRDQRGALESGIKYLVQSAVGSALVLLGIALVFALTGTLTLNQLPQIAAAGNPLLMAAGALFVIGFGVKIALVPLHTWLPDAHSQAPSGISIMLSGIVIEAGLVALLRVLSAMSVVTTLWGPILLGFAAINMLVGNLMALRQTEVKRMLAYSSVAQVGYMLLGFGFTFVFQSGDGAISGFFHLMNHALMKGLAFMAAGALIYVFFIKKGSHGTLHVEDLNGAAKKYPVAAFTFSVAVLALGGLPPLSGFMSKTSIFISGFNSQNVPVMILVVFGALNAILSLGYYAPLVNRLYRLQPSAAVKAGAAMPKLMALPLILLAAAIIVLGFYPTLLKDFYVAAGMGVLSYVGQ